MDWNSVNWCFTGICFESLHIPFWVKSLLLLVLLTLQGITSIFLPWSFSYQLQYLCHIYLHFYFILQVFPLLWKQIGVSAQKQLTGFLLHRLKVSVCVLLTSCWGVCVSQGLCLLRLAFFAVILRELGPAFLLPLKVPSAHLAWAPSPEAADEEQTLLFFLNFFLVVLVFIDVWGLSLVAASRGSSLDVVHWLLIAVASRLLDSIVVAQGL